MSFYRTGGIGISAPRFSSQYVPSVPPDAVKDRVAVLEIEHEKKGGLSTLFRKYGDAPNRAYTLVVGTTDEIASSPRGTRDSQ